ncbi:MAG TPA: hypothetical protein VM580_05795 [Labilithrix sp.]|nr:hypothetical protein [Labilithrix sp.]
MIDTGVVENLLRTVHAVSLLGAKALLVGIAPSVAQTMVQLGANLAGVVTLRNLQAGLAYGLRHIGLQISAV